mgnify:CR=1 FL=1
MTGSAAGATTLLSAFDSPRFKSRCCCCFFSCSAFLAFFASARPAFFKASNKTLQEVSVFDVYEGDKIDSTKKSIAFNLIFNGMDRTLTDEEVMEVFNKIISDVENKTNSKLRS